MEPALEGDKQLILMTHDGPQDYATSNATLRDTGIELLKDGFYRFGSAALAKLIKDKQEQLVCNVHGHNHFGAFMDFCRPKLQPFCRELDPEYTRPEKWTVPVPIVNPGSLQWGEYGELMLGKVKGKWQVLDANKKFLV